MVNDYMLDKKLNKIKKTIGIKKFDDVKVLIDTNDKLSDDITFKNCLILTACVIKYVCYINMYDINIIY